MSKPEEKLPTFDCPYCDKRMKDANGLWMHVRKKHPERPKAHLKPKPVEDDESMGAIFRAMKEHNRERKSNNLKNADSTGWTVHCETHWSQKFLGERIDYWPSTTRFRWKGRTYTGDVIGFMSNRMKEFLEKHEA